MRNPRMAVFVYVVWGGMLAFLISEVHHMNMEML